MVVVVGMSANKQMVLTLPARGSFCIIARHTGLVVASASYCRTSEALACSSHEHSPSRTRKRGRVRHRRMHER
jgi:hypothetical protein